MRILFWIPYFPQLLQCHWFRLDSHYVWCIIRWCRFQVHLLVVKSHLATNLMWVATRLFLFFFGGSNCGFRFGNALSTFLWLWCLILSRDSQEGNILHKLVAQFLLEELIDFLVVMREQGVQDFLSWILWERSCNCKWEAEEVFLHTALQIKVYPSILKKLYLLLVVLMNAFIDKGQQVGAVDPTHHIEQYKIMHAELRILC